MPPEKTCCCSGSLQALHLFPIPHACRVYRNADLFNCVSRVFGANLAGFGLAVDLAEIAPYEAGFEFNQSDVRLKN